MAIRPLIAIIARIALFPVGLLIAAGSLVHAASEVEAFSVGPGAMTDWGLDAHIVGTLADSGFKAQTAARQAEEQGEFPKLSDSLLKLAKASFAADPLEVPSLRSIALGGMLQTDPTRASEVMKLAGQLSRRDSITNLWLAQHYFEAGDVEAMLTSFDHALRTSARVREFAMKPVVESLASEESYAPLGKLLAARPEWEADFWREFVRNPVGLQNAVSFLKSNRLPPDRIPDADRSRLNANLKSASQYEALFGLAALDPTLKEDIAALEAGAFVIGNGFNPLGWTVRSEGRYAARVQESTGELQIDARAGAFGVAADRVVRGGGDRRLRIRMAEPVPDNVELKLSVRCLDEGGNVLSSITLAPGARSDEADFSTGDCHFANIQLSFSAEAGRRDALIRIASIKLEDA